MLTGDGAQPAAPAQNRTSTATFQRSVSNTGAADRRAL
jgi:hypothetical protein